MNPLDAVTTRLSCLQISTQPLHDTLPDQSPDLVCSPELLHRNEYINSQGTVLKPVALTLSTASYPSLFNFLHGQRTAGTTTFTLFGVLQTLYATLSHHMTESAVAVTGEELYKLLGTAFLQEATKAFSGMKLSEEVQQTSSMPPSCLTIRFHLNSTCTADVRHPCITNLHTRLLQHFNGQLQPCFVRDDADNHFSGFSLETHLSGHFQKLIFIFETQIAPFFATSDALQLKILDGQYALIDHKLGSQWLVDTLFKWLRIPDGHTLHNPTKMIVRHMRNGFLPLPRVYEAFASDQNPLEQIYKIQADCPEQLAESLFILLHLLSATTDTSPVIPTLTPPFKSCAHAHLYLMQQTGIRFNQLQALITTVCLITGGLKKTRLMRVLDQLELVVDQIRLPIALEQAARTLLTIDPALFNTEAFTLWIDYNLVQDSRQALLKTALETPTVKGPVECLVAMAYRCSGIHADIVHFICSSIAHSPPALRRLYLQCPEIAELLGQNPSSLEAPYIIQQLFSNPVPIFHDLAVTLLLELNNHDLTEKWACTLLGKQCDRSVLKKLISKEPSVINALISTNPAACLDLAPTLSQRDCDHILEALSQKPESSELAFHYIEAMADYVSKNKPFHPLYLLRACCKHVDQCKNPRWIACVQAAYAQIAFEDIPQELFSQLLHPAFFVYTPDQSATFIQRLTQQQKSLTQEMKKCIRLLLSSLADIPPHVTVAVLMLHQTACGDTISDAHKTLLVDSCFQDLSNGSHLSEQCLRWYLSRETLQLIVKKVDPALQVHLFLLLCRKAEGLIEQRHVEYVTALSRRPQATATLQKDLEATTKACPRLLERLPTLLAPLEPPQETTTPSPKKPPPDEVKTLLVQKQYDQVVQYLTEKQASDKQVLTAVNALIDTSSPHVFTLFKHYTLKESSLWERAFKACTEANNQEGFCTGVCTMLQMQEQLDDKLMLKLTEFMFDNPLWTGDCRALAFLCDAKSLARCLILPNQKLYTILDRLSLHLSQKKEYLSHALTWYGLLSPTLPKKSQLGWRLFSLLDDSSDELSVRKLAGYTKGLLSHVDTLLGPTSKANASHIATICQTFSTFIALSLKYNCGRDAVSSLLDHLQRFEIAAVHEMLCCALIDHSDALLLGHLENSLLTLVRLKGYSDPFVHKSVLQHIARGSNEFLIELYTLIFVPKGLKPSAVSADKLARCTAIAHTPSQFQQNPSFDGLHTHYPRLLATATNDSTFAQRVLDIDLSLHLHKHIEVQTFVKSLLPGHQDLQFLLFCHQLERDGWSDKTQNLLGNLTVVTLGNPLAAQPLAGVAYEITQLPVISSRYYQTAMKSVHNAALTRIPVNEPKTDLFTIVLRLPPIHSELCPSEVAYINMVSSLCRIIFTVWKTKPVPLHVRAYMYDFALQLMRVCIEKYPQHINTELFDTYISSISTDELLFSAHKEISLSILRQALYYNAISLDTIKSKCLLDKIGATEQDLAPQQSLDMIAIINVETEKHTQDTHVLTAAEILYLQNMLFEWQEFQFSDDFEIRLTALTALFSLWKRLPTCVDDVSITTSFDTLLFPNGTFYGIHLPRGKEHALQVTKLIAESLVTMYQKALIEKPTDPAHAFRFLNRLLTYLEKAEHTDLFFGNYQFFADLMTRLVTLISKNHSQRLESLDMLIDRITRLCAVGPAESSCLATRINLLDTWFTLFKKIKKGQDKPLSYALKPLIQSTIICYIPEDKYTHVLSWLNILYVKMGTVIKLQFKTVLAKQLAGQKAFCPGGTLYEDLDESLKQAIALLQKK